MDRPGIHMYSVQGGSDRRQRNAEPDVLELDTTLCDELIATDARLAGSDVVLGVPANPPPPARDPLTGRIEAGFTSGGLNSPCRPSTGTKPATDTVGAGRRRTS